MELLLTNTHYQIGSFSNFVGATLLLPQPEPQVLRFQAIINTSFRSRLSIRYSFLRFCTQHRLL